MSLIQLLDDDPAIMVENILPRLRDMKSWLSTAKQELTYQDHP